MFSPPSLLETDSRPFSLPKGKWLMAQRWSHLLFANYAYAPDVVAAKLPSGIELETFEGQAWLSLVPFELAFSLKGLHRTSFQIEFNELNLRTYVRYNGVPGVYFFCLDATDKFSVEVARAFFHLNYFNAVSSCEVSTAANGHKQIAYESTRRDSRANTAVFAAKYAPCGPVLRSQPGTLEHWLTERYCFFSVSPAGKVYRGDIHHEPWPLQFAEAELNPDSLLNAHGFLPPSFKGVFYYSDSIEVVSWPISKTNV